MLKLFLTLTAGMAVLLASHAPAAEPMEDMENTLATVLDRYRADLLNASTSESWADELADRLDPQGRWRDIRYDDKQRTQWEPRKHVARMRQLALAIATADQPKPAWTHALQRAARHWTQAKYVCDNWWYNEIGVPMQMADTLALAGDRLDEGLRKQCLDVVAQAKLGDSPYTGQNLIWKAQLVLLRAAMIGDGDLAARAMEDIAETIVITTDEGIQPDYSFHQHGPQLMNGAYGMGFARDVTQIIALVADTKLAVDAERVNVMADYFLRGQQWMMRGPTMAAITNGRAMTRHHARLRSTGPLIVACRRLADVVADADRRKQLLDFARRQDASDGEIKPPLVGNRVFWRSDFVTHHRPGWMMAVKMASERTLRTESINSENLRGCHLDDGFMALMVRGDEYAGIQPVWDWRKLPGVTCVDGGDVKMANGSPPGETAMVGGLSNGEVGMATMTLDHRRGKTHATGKLAWFFLPDRVVALGADLAGEGDGPLVTTLNQCRLVGDVSAADGGRIVEHDGIVYRVVGEADVHHAAQTQRGTWYDINHAGPKEPVELDVFTMWIDHGRDARDAAYHYEILPGCSVGDAAGRNAAAASPATLLRNSADCQAIVSPDGQFLMAVFHLPGDLQADGWPELRVKAPCLIMLHRAEGSLTLYAAMPRQTLSRLKMHVDGKAHDISFEPDKLPAGQSFDKLNRTARLVITPE